MLRYEYHRDTDTDFLKNTDIPIPIIGLALHLIGSSQKLPEKHPINTDKISKKVLRKTKKHLRKAQKTPEKHSIDSHDPE